MQSAFEKLPPTSEKKGVNYWKISTLVLCVLLVITLFFFKQRSFPAFKLSTNDVEKPHLIVQPSQSVEEMESNSTREFFISEYLNNFLKFKSEVKPESIKRVFPIPVKQIELTESQSWLIEYETGPEALSYYLLTPTIEKELINAKSCVSQDQNPPIELQDIQVNNIGNGYIVLSGEKNSCYGGEGSGFISVYTSKTGEKIPLTGNFRQPGSTWKGVSLTGNALGVFRGIYGYKNPIIVVEYGAFAGNNRKFGDFGTFAFFDLQSGKLKQLVELQ